MSRQDRDNRAYHFVLDCEDVVKLTVISFGPAMGAGLGLDKLRRDADAVAAPPDASLQYVPHTQLPPDLPDID